MPGPKQDRPAETAMPNGRSDGEMPSGEMTSPTATGMPSGKMVSRAESEMPRGEMRQATAAGMPRGDMRASGPATGTSAARMPGTDGGTTSMPSGSMRSAAKMEGCPGCGGADDPRD